MTLSNHTYRNLLSLSLALILSFGALGPSFHHLFGHQHQNSKHCHSSVAHIHSDEYAPQVCWVCAFAFSTFEPTSDLSYSGSVQIAELKPLFAYQVFLPNSLLTQYFLRGPPAVQALI